MITGPAWVDTAAQRFVRSWFNRKRFADDAILAGAYGMMTNTSQNWTGLQVYLDSVAVGVGLDINIVSAASRATYNPLWPTDVAADGYHYVTFGMATVGGGTASVASYHGMAAIATVG